jgi:proteasome lid subunit RPN8/RPN11
MNESESQVRLFPRTDTTPRPSDLHPHAPVRWCPPFKDTADAVVSVYMTAGAYALIDEHSRMDLEVEVGGGLVGSWVQECNSGAQFVIVEAALPARFTRHGSAFLTFTQDTLVAMNDELEAQHPERLLVGWYHTHPRMGIFLSHYDVWLHEHFFPEPWQIALVLEPHAGHGGFFIRQNNGDFDPQRYFGCYELVERGEASILDWANLERDEAPREPDREVSDE